MGDLLLKAAIIVLNGLLWLVFIVIAFLFFLGAVILRAVTWPFDPNLRLLHQYSCLWASVYLWLNPFWSLKKGGLKNVDPKKSYVIVSNHQSWADIIVLFNTFIHFKWVSKKSVFNAPFLGWNMRLNGYVPINRGNDASREKCMDLCREWLAKGSSVLFFPEGTRSLERGKMLPFKIGAFKLAMESGRDVLPIVVKGSIDAIPKNSILLHRKARMAVEVLPPVSIDSFLGNASGVESLMNHVRIQMARKLP
jgi:1-acyl-sn-glycerol-3-phosphate acyltransferase